MDFHERRLPVYLLLDVSESMLDEGIEALQRGLSALMMDLHGNAQALETAWVSIITFADRAEQVVPLTELGEVRVPPLKCRPGTALGGALTLLEECIRREVRTQSAEVKGDWKPLVFLLTDGIPTDDWEGPAARLKNMAGRHPANLIAVACGDEVDPYVLMQVSGNVLMMRDGADDFQKLFHWISASISVTSKAITSPDPGPVSLEKLPDGIVPASAGGPRPRSRMQPVVFLPLRCSRTRRPYLVRYRLNEEYQGYEPVRTHKVDEEYFAGGGSDTALDISSRQIFGILPCPHCRSDSAGRCSCGQLLCAADEDMTVTCPGCERTLEFSGHGGGAFSLSGRMG